MRAIVSIREFTLIAGMSLLLGMFGATSTAMAQSCCSQQVCSTPSATCGSGVPYHDVNYCLYSGGCPQNYANMGNGCCCGWTPIVIDVDGNGFDLSSAENGVPFRISVERDVMARVAWTKAGSDDSWLVLDRNGNSLVDGAEELFGNQTPLPPGYNWPAGVTKNGFAVLSVYDERQFGGNANGKLDAGDLVFAALRLWRDYNHNGISEHIELTSLTSAGITSIELDYKESRQTDEHGNQFRWRSKLVRNHDSEVAKWAWDVLLSVLPIQGPILSFSLHSSQ